MNEMSELGTGGINGGRGLPPLESDRPRRYCGVTVVGPGVRLRTIELYGTVADHAEVSPDSKPSAKISGPAGSVVADDVFE